MPYKAVVVGGGERIVFVVMTAGAGDGQTEHRFAHRVDRIFDRQVHVLVDVVAEPPRNRQIAGGDDSIFVLIGWSARRQQVTGDLLGG